VQIRGLLDAVKNLTPGETPFTTMLGGKKPVFCIQYYQEPKEPVHSIWVEAKGLLDSLTHWEDDEFWTPSPQYRDLERIVDRLYQVAFALVPNLEYDAERCRREWKGRPINQKKITWGMSDLVEVPEENVGT
jgi:hypothetical protein